MPLLQPHGSSIVLRHNAATRLYLRAVVGLLRPPLRLDNGELTLLKVYQRSASEMVNELVVMGMQRGEDFVLTSAGCVHGGAPEWLVVSKAPEPVHAEPRLPPGWTIQTVWQAASTLMFDLHPMAASVPKISSDLATHSDLPSVATFKAIARHLETTSSGSVLHIAIDDMLLPHALISESEDKRQRFVRALADGILRNLEFICGKGKSFIAGLEDDAFVIYVMQSSLAMTLAEEIIKDAAMIAAPDKAALTQRDTNRLAAPISIGIADCAGMELESAMVAAADAAVSRQFMMGSRIARADAPTFNMLDNSRSPRLI